MTEASSETAVIEGLLPELEAEGFETFLRPAPPLVPAFLGSYRPDVIALKPDRKLAIEVKHRADKTGRPIESITKLFDGHPDWELRVVWINPANSGSILDEQSPNTINGRIVELRDLVGKGFSGPALLLGWATFEAVGRRLLSDDFARPQTPGRLVEVLAAQGFVTPDEADFLRLLAQKRNRLIHGDLETDISTGDVTGFADILEFLAKSAA